MAKSGAFGSTESGNDHPSSRAEFLSVGAAEVLEPRAPMSVPPTEFPTHGAGEDDIWQELLTRLAGNARPQDNWSVYGVEAHPLAKRILALDSAVDSYTVEFLQEIYPGTAHMSQEAVRMIGALLNADDPHGFLTTGGTESNLLAMRLARNLSSTSAPEIIAPVTRHYSFDLAAELFGMRLRTVGLTENHTPDVEQVSSLVTDDTVALVCSAPEAELGRIDPVPQFAAIAQEHGLYLHVDGAIGGFLLPFAERLGLELPLFDFRLPEVMSMTADVHKLGLGARPTSALIIRDGEFVERAIPIGDVIIDTLSASGRAGASSVAAWALFRHLGVDGYKELVGHQLELHRLICAALRSVDEVSFVVEPALPMICFTTIGDINVGELSRLLWERGYIIPLNELQSNGVRYLRIIVHPLKSNEAAEGLIDAILDSIARLRRGERAGIDLAARVW